MRRIKPKRLSQGAPGKDNGGKVAHGRQPAKPSSKDLQGRRPAAKRAQPSRHEEGSGSGDYAVGYGRPPRAYRFRPGHSGNPRGRRKGAKSEATILRNLLNRKINVRQNGRRRKITVFEAILLRFTEDALKGNIKAAAFLFNRYAGTRDEDSELSDKISDEDRQVLETFVRQFEAQHRAKADRI